MFIQRYQLPDEMGISKCKSNDFEILICFILFEAKIKSLASKQKQALDLFRIR